MSGGCYNNTDNTYQRGLFGEATSGINWCEIDYRHTTYFAEFYNTLTNLSFNFAGIICYKKCKQYDLGLMYFFLCFNLHMLGLTSGLFHASLWWSGQKLDEIFMNFPSLISPINLKF